MTLSRFHHVIIESMEVHLPTIEITSCSLEERLKPLYQRLNIPFGMLERLTGIKRRYIWAPSTLPSTVATIAAEKAIETSKIPRDKIGALISCSITRDCFEPATALLIHRNLGLSKNSLTFDLSNACVGFSDGLSVVAHLIESGVIEAGIVVAGETFSEMVDQCIHELLRNDNLTREQFLTFFPTLTLGSGSVAYLLCHENIAHSAHRLLASSAYSASEHVDLCVVEGDYCLSQGEGFRPIMRTESGKLISEGARIGARNLVDLSQAVKWIPEEIDHIFCHQVGRQVNPSHFMGTRLDDNKEFIIYPDYGNIGAAGLPTAMAIGREQKKMEKGEKVLWMGFGSGINSRFCAIEW